MKNFSFEERNTTLSQIEGEHYDVIVIGGGITGTGISLDSVTRGMKTLVIEMQDFAAGTSSRSTKLVHGGLRYLKQLEVKMVADVGKEREVVYLNAPHVTHPEWMLLPIYRNGTFGKYSTSLGLKVYDFLAGVKRYERRKMLSIKETIEKEPLLKKDGLIGGGYYVEYRTDDARLTIEVAKKASQKGAALLNYTKAKSFIYSDDGKICGVFIKDVLTGDTYQVYGKKIVNASGPWVENLIGLDKKIIGKSLQHTKGIHIVIDESRFPLRQAVYFDTPDGRMVFAIPRDGKTYIGTTDTIFENDLTYPKVDIEDKKYLLECINFVFPETKLEMSDIESTWAGVRPLIREIGKGPSEISRKDEIWISNTGLITIAGGKLTGYRKMAETVTDLLSKELEASGVKVGKSVTKKMRLSGGDFKNPEDYSNFIVAKGNVLSKLGIPIDEAMNISAVYGTNTDILIELADEVLKETALPLAIKLILHYSIKHEMTLTAVDFFLRRTGKILFDIHWVHTWKSEVINYMALMMEWDEKRKEIIREDLELRIHEAAH
ncbi:glycerol-3-phosphate dehydrogenase/oxidase [Psychrobacillus vulpis]|uniref:Aerobic glycerol-3-phosphate dehydrogenase n=1 Tax=Psychrobacillus vulpis TaxID=2325572 RepID=A0A544TSI5_9BACI|nr:glycerol-3-phosphate dehydrogenase/oxidase [Psychrobacillus vulpis]TQR20370.1 glycerol-3-phosphate dehydrogenase/oxidase [Psychrobacillus vulpis]